MRTMFESLSRKGAAALGSATFVTALLLPGSAQALLKIYDVPPDFVVQDAEDNSFKVSALRASRPTLIVYEDKDGGGQNKPFLERLGKLREKDAAAKKLVILAIADVGSWDFFPAKNFVKSALRSEGAKSGITVYADWSTSGRTALSTKASVSNMVVLDKTGKVVWASAGKLNKTQEDAMLDVILKQGS